MEDHVPRHAQMGAWVLINDRWYDMLAEFITEATDLELGLLPVADRMAFYRKSRDHCISGT